MTSLQKVKLFLLVAAQVIAALLADDANEDVVHIDCAADNTYVNITLSDTTEIDDVVFESSHRLQILTPTEECQMFWSGTNNTVLKQSLMLYCGGSMFVCKATCAVNPSKEIEIIITIKRDATYDMAFTQPVYKASLMEMVTPGTLISLDQADPGLQMNCSIGTAEDLGNSFYSVQDTDVPFIIIAETNIGSLQVTDTLDYEKKTSYEIKIRGWTDNVKGNATAVVHIQVIDVDDNSPKFNIGPTERYILNVSEQNASLVGISLNTTPPIYAYDPDYGFNETILYEIIAISPRREDVEFSMENTTGEITIHGNIDYELQKQYTITIKAYQENKPSSRTAIATVQVMVTDVDDNLPYFEPDHIVVTVTEHMPVGTTVTHINAIDLDTDGEFGFITYNMLPDNPLFRLQKLDNHTAALIVRNSTQLDRELYDEVQLNIQAMGHAGVEGTNNLTLDVVLLDVNDNTPTFAQDDYTLHANETLKTDDVIGKVSALDEDSGVNGMVRHTILTGTMDTGDCTNIAQTPFVVRNTTGEVVMTTTGFPCDEYRFILQACDSPVAESPRCSVARVTITHTPSTGSRYIQQQFTIPEELPVGTYIGLLVCSGPALTYTIADNADFIANTSGLLTGRVLDREQNSTYAFLVVVSRSGQVVCDINVTVTLLDINDNAPVFTSDSYQFTVQSDVGPNTSIGRIQASDTDEGENKLISYSISNPWVHGLVIDASSGEIWTTEQAIALNDITQLIVTATDHGQPHRKAIAVVYITKGGGPVRSLPIRTPWSEERVKENIADIQMKISRILQLDVVVSSVEAIDNDASNSTARSRIYLSPTDASITQDVFLREVFYQYEAIRALFVDQQPVIDVDSDADDDDGLGAAEIALIAMGVVILIGAILAIVIINRQFNRQKRYRQLYENMTKESTLYESQEIKVNLPDEISADYDFADTAEEPGAVAFVNPVMVEYANTNNPEDVTIVKEVMDSLDQLSDRLDEEEEDNKHENENTDPPQPGTSSNSLTNNNPTDDVMPTEDNNPAINDDMSEHVVYANVPMNAHEDDRVDDVIVDQNESQGHANNSRNSDCDASTAAGTDGENLDEPNPDYDIKAVRFHTEVLDADDNKLQPLKVKEENGTDAEGVSHESGPQNQNAEHGDHEENKGGKKGGGNPEQNIYMNADTARGIGGDADQSFETGQPNVDGERPEEEIDSRVFQENIPTDFYFGGNEVSTHF